jgi:RNA polymerase sigma factor for flagellar operon FliA
MIETLQRPASIAETISVVDAVLAAVARRVPPQVSREDLASAGKLALVEALLRYAGPPEQTRAYCYVRVRGAVLDELRRLDPLSRHARAQVTAVRRARSAIEQRLGRAPTTAEVAEVTGLQAAAVDRVDQLAHAAAVCSIDETDGEGGLLHVFADPNAACPARSAESDDATASVQAALERLAPNQAHVLRRYYLDDATLEDIAAELGVSKERVRQIREVAEKKLRADFIVLALWQSFLTQR